MNIPLPEYLSTVLVDFKQQYDDADGDKPSLEMLLNFLNRIDDKGIRFKLIAEEVVVSTRVARMAVDRLEKQGLVASSGTGVNRIVQLTEAGRRARDNGREALDRTEAAWQRQFGKANVKELRARLIALVERFEYVWPAQIVGYGTGDNSITGAGYRRQDQAEPLLGEEWSSVPRTSADLSTCPLTSLLSQVLAAFASDYEFRGHGALQVAARVMQAIPASGLPLRDAMLIADVNGSGKSTLERHRFVTVAPGKGKQRLVHLTIERGIPCRDAYQRLCKEIETDWRKRYGKERVEKLRLALSPFVDDKPITRFPDITAWLEYS